MIPSLPRQSLAMPATPFELWTHGSLPSTRRCMPTTTGPVPLVRGYVSEYKMSTEAHFPAVSCPSALLVAPINPRVVKRRLTFLGLPPSLDGAADAQLPNLLQHLFDAGIQLALCVLIPRVRIQVLLHLRHARVCLGAEAQLDLDERLKRRV